MAGWWYVENGTAVGPVEIDDLRRAIASHRVTRETLVWCDGLVEWQAASETVDLADMFHVRRPPPIPNVPSAVTRGDEPVSLTYSAEKSKATWFRYFARHIDTVLLGFPSLVAFGLALGYLLVLLSPRSIHLINDNVASWIIAFIGLWLIFPFVEAASLFAFGNTPGKAIFGLKLIKVDGEATFADYLWRTHGMAASGLGFYLPFISLVTCISQYQNVKSKGQTSYDEGTFEIRERPIGRVRLILALTLWLFCFLLSFAANSGGRR